MAFVMLPTFLILALIFFSPWWLGILIFLSLPLSGLFAWDYYLVFKRIIGGFKARTLIRNGDREFDLLRKNHLELLNLIRELKLNEI